MHFVNSLDRVVNHKWYSKVTIVINKEYSFKAEALIDTGADLNCISEGIVPTSYFKKTTQILNTANGGRMPIHYKLSNAAICNNGVCLETTFLLSKELSRIVILGTPFINMLYPFKTTTEGIKTKIDGYPIIFKFTKEPQIHEVNYLKGKITEKEKFLFSLKEEVNYKAIQQKTLKKYKRRFNLSKRNLKRRYALKSLVHFGKERNIW